MQWYGHVEIHGGHAIGQWFCVDLATGRVLWDRALGAPNSIRCVNDDVIVASEMRSGGPWTANFGIFVIDRHRGDLLWRSQGAGCLGFLLSFLPGKRARGMGTAAALLGSELFSTEGEVLDVRTGEHLRFVDVDAIPDQSRQETDAAHMLYEGRAVSVGGVDSLSVKAGWDGFVAERTGSHPWRYEVPGHHVDSNFFSWRYSAGVILIVAADAPVFVSTGEHSMKENACRYELRVLDVSTGEVTQTIPLTTDPGGPCRIESLDDSVVLVSHGKTLWCYAWR